MVLTRLFIVALFSIVFSSRSDAQLIFTDPGWLFVENTEAFDVHVDDQVDDGCWLSPERSKTKVSLQLIRSNYGIIEDSDELAAFAPKVILSGMGYETSEYSCAVVVSASIYAISIRDFGDENREVSAMFNYPLWSSKFLLTGSKSDMSDRISEIHESLIEQFLVQVSKNSKKVQLEIIEAAPESDKSYWRSFFSD